MTGNGIRDTAEACCFNQQFPPDTGPVLYLTSYLLKSCLPMLIKPCRSAGLLWGMRHRAARQCAGFLKADADFVTAPFF